MEKNVLVVNFKTYRTGTGRDALNLARVHEGVAGMARKKIIIAVQAADIFRISREVSLDIFAQHADPVAFGTFTGFLLPEALKEGGASGTLLNHAENRMDDSRLKDAIKRCKSVGLETLVCTDSISQARMLAKLSPTYIAFEEPELISTGMSVSRVNPESVRGFVKAVRKSGPSVIPLCGAGVSTGDDVRKALELGTRGALVSSAVMKSDRPRDLLFDLVKHL